MTAIHLSAYAVPILFWVAMLCTSWAATAEPVVQVTETGTGLKHEVTVEAATRFRLVFEARKNYGITKWFDLSGDPVGETDLLANPTDYILLHAQGALFNQCLNPGDLIGHVAAGGSLHKGVPRSIRIVPSPPDRAAIENRYSPMLGDVNRELVFRTLYVIHADGRIYVRSVLSAAQAQRITLWRNSVITLGDPTFHTKVAGKLVAELTGPNQLSVSGVDWKPDEWAGYVVEQDDYRYYDIVSNTRSVLTVNPQDPNKRASSGALSIRSHRVKYGWLRCDSMSRPVGWHREPAEFLYAFWDPTTPEPYQHWTKASILLVPSPANPRQGRGGRIHGWRGCKRLFFETGAFDLGARESVTQDYMIQLGSSDGGLPDLSNLATCRALAKQYRSEKHEQPDAR
ncbi:MAG: hypothetical protein HN742_23770 [Lentisphaerae bacterium]|jgi:hypothetical protein|nr:hypothetical protein [Lentisphaerota bacterium]MBT4817080.1 hypothetical protein [Lentisphaerota bacterium]MBT5612812.1 hypothetical protein [Lentisphaerota bacterium]MBT7057638.1 hypothetical protein [Lentisphaerota bacterium]MBT7844915.1 hypothetical protein [Lentisphaerota bacterium]